MALLSRHSTLQLILFTLLDFQSGWVSAWVLQESIPSLLPVLLSLQPYISDEGREAVLQGLLSQLTLN